MVNGSESTGALAAHYPETRTVPRLYYDAPDANSAQYRESLRRGSASRSYAIAVLPADVPAMRPNTVPDMSPVPPG